MDTTKSKRKYIDAWNSHIESLYTLCLTPSYELGKEVKANIDKLKELVVKVATDKGLK